ncbi:MAG: DUF4214 domain-containing protein [Pseudomonadota bacterium]
MTNEIGGFAVRRGTEVQDAMVGTAERAVLFGLEGPDRMRNTSADGETYLVGGTGNDVYQVSPNSFTVIHETGGDVNDEYIDSIVVGAGDPVVATVDGRHLLFNYPLTGSAVFIIDWEEPENRIEIFRLYDGVGLVGITFEELRDQVDELPGFIGDVSFESLGLIENLEDGIELLIEAVDTGTLPGGLTLEEAQSVALLYEAGLGRAADAPGLNFWIDQREGTLTDRDLALAFVESPEFEQEVGDPDTISEEDLVEALYVNVLERQGDAAGVAFWTGFAQQANVEAADLLLAFSASDENVNAADNLDQLTEITPGFWDFA